MGDVSALEDDPAPARRRESDDRIHQRRLADAVASEQPQDLALLDLQGHSLQHVGITVIGVDVVNVQNRHNLVSRSRSSQDLAVPSDANFGIKGTLALYDF